MVGPELGLEFRAWKARLDALGATELAEDFAEPGSRPNLRPFAKLLPIRRGDGTGRVSEQAHAFGEGYPSR